MGNGLILYSGSKKHESDRRRGDLARPIQTLHSSSLWTSFFLGGGLGSLWNEGPVVYCLDKAIQKISLWSTFTQRGREKQEWFLRTYACLWGWTGLLWRRGNFSSYGLSWRKEGRKAERAHDLKATTSEALYMPFSSKCPVSRSTYLRVAVSKATPSSSCTFICPPSDIPPESKSIRVSGQFIHQLNIFFFSCNES